MGLDRSLKRVFPALVLALIGVAAYFQASGLGQILVSLGLDKDSLPATPAPTKHAPPALLANTDHAVSGTAILDRNPFDSITGPLHDRPAPASPETPPDEDDAPTCDSGRVVLITWSEDPAWSFASIADGNGKSVLRRAGDEVGSYKVDRIEWDRVWMATDAGRKCQMEVGGKLPASNGRPPADQNKPPLVPPVKSRVPSEIASKIHVIDGGRVTIERSVVPLLMEQQAQLFRSVRAAPDKDGGLKIAGVKPGTVLDMVGVKNDDRLMTINGLSMADPGSALQAYTKLREAPHLTVVLQRDGKPKTVEVDIQ